MRIEHAVPPSHLPSNSPRYNKNKNTTRGCASTGGGRSFHCGAHSSVCSGDLPNSLNIKYALAMQCISTVEIGA